jgi:hypothetical protein
MIGTPLSARTEWRHFRLQLHIKSALAGPKTPGEQSFSMAVKVLIAGDLGGWDDSARHGLLSHGAPIKPIQRELAELYTLDYL